MESMNNVVRIAPLALFAAAAMAAALFAGCTRHVSRDISPQGQAGEVVFPALDRIVLKEGTFPTKEAIRQIGPGATRDQLYDLIGRPHFREGFNAREWDYLFHFRERDRVVTCQYKVIFDSQLRGQSFHWSPAECADLLKEEDTPDPTVKRFDLSADALFAFAKSGREDMLPGGRDELKKVADALKASKAAVVQVVGHTDRIGGEESNQALSQRRADTVRAILIENGVPSDGVTAHGAGESQPVKQCDDALPHEALVACLQPNRRVEVVAKGVR